MPAQELEAWQNHATTALTELNAGPNAGHDRFAIRTTLDTFREKEAIILAISLMLAMTDPILSRPCDVWFAAPYSKPSPSVLGNFLKAAIFAIAARLRPIAFDHGKQACISSVNLAGAGPPMEVVPCLLISQLSTRHISGIRPYGVADLRC
jgi:hypothetical protein